MKVDSSKYPLPARLRHHTSPNLYLPVAQLNSKPDYYPPLYDELDYQKIFINGKEPDYLDIGCGKGQFLLDFAELYSVNNILGIELRKNVAEWLEQIIIGERLQNCSVLWYSVANGLPFIESESIESVFYLFPDPWPKKKHNKRRAFNSEFLNECNRVLKTNGRLYLATDVEEVHDYHVSVLSSTGQFKFTLVDTNDSWNLPLSNKEKFCLIKHIKTYKLICYKKTDSV
jgi:tRNA (guanine-N(7)-)-methyltransferase